MKLSEAEIGKEYKITNLDLLGRNIRKRLLDLGISNCEFKIVTNNRGPVLIELRGTRLAIGRGMAVKIEIKMKDEKNA